MRRLRVGENISLRQIPKDKEGYSNPDKVIPEPYDLCELEVYQKGKKRIYRGWWTGGKWYCHRLPEPPNVLRWKRVEDRRYTIE